MLKRMMIMLFVLILANIYVAASFYLTTGAPLVFGIFAVVFLLQLMMLVLRFKEEDWRKSQPQLGPLVFVVRLLSLLALGGFSIIFAFTAVRDITLFVANFFITPESRETAAMISLQADVGLTALVMLIGVVQALRGPGIKSVQVALAGLPTAFEGFRIVQISDLHIGPTIRRAYVNNVVQAVNGLKPDMIALTGDITDGSSEELHGIAKQLGEMHSTFGRYFVTGNHEYYWDAPAWIKVHREFGTRVLINENHLIKKDGAELAILGVPDVSAHHFVPSHKSNPSVAAEGIKSETIKILLAHQPISYKAAHMAGVNLQLSGHTHSGQFFPWNLVIGLFHDYYRGLNRFKEMWIYVNQGTGYWGPPLRAAVSSEITLLTLTCASKLS